MKTLLNTEDLAKAYIQLEDPSEYYYALQYFNSYTNWLKYVDAHKDEVDLWRKELEAKIKSDAIGRIIEASKGDSRDALGANKFLLDLPWKETNGKGRPSKQDILTETKRIVDYNKQLENDYLLLQEYNP
jgi:hypothetical protein